VKTSSSRIKNFDKVVNIVVILFLWLIFPHCVSTSKIYHNSEKESQYLFFSELPSITGDRTLLSDRFGATTQEVILVSKDIFGQELSEDDQEVSFTEEGEAEAEEGEAEEDSFAEEGEAEEDPFAEEGEAEEDPFAEEGEAEEDPFAEEGKAEEGEAEEDPFAEEVEAEEVAVPANMPDNAMGFNRFMYKFNDKMYFWVLKPVSQGYGFIMPEVARIGVRNFFDNLRFPVRFFNCLFQGKVKDSGVELARFGINTTVGILGFIDIAEKIPLEEKKEDLDQTLAVYGFGTGTYLMWPFLGPSSVRGTFGFIGDMILNPATYIPGSGIFKTINNTSLRIGEYEALKKASIDPYIAIRNAYYQHRIELIKH
jgi:phospholipid-binding lipoprotein MlaA